MCPKQAGRASDDESRAYWLLEMIRDSSDDAHAATSAAALIRTIGSVRSRGSHAYQGMRQADIKEIRRLCRRGGITEARLRRMQSPSSFPNRGRHDCQEKALEFYRRRIAG